MARKPSALAGIFDDEPGTAEPTRGGKPAEAEAGRRGAQAGTAARAGQSRNHGTKKPVLIHIPEDMHRKLRQLSVEDGEPLTVITERMLRQYLVSKGHTRFAPPDPG